MVAAEGPRWVKQGMDLRNKYRIRVKNCIGTILDVHRSMSPPFDHRAFISQFERLKTAVNHINMNEVTEQDVVRVERATNALLGEFRPIFERGDVGPIYRKVMH